MFGSILQAAIHFSHPKENMLYVITFWWEFLNLISVTLIYIDDVPVLKWPVSQYGQTWPAFEDQILFVWEKNMSDNNNSNLICLFPQ